MKVYYCCSCYLTMHSCERIVPLPTRMIRQTRRRRNMYRRLQRWLVQRRQRFHHKLRKAPWYIPQCSHYLFASLRVDQCTRLSVTHYACHHIYMNHTGLTPVIYPLNAALSVVCVPSCSPVDSVELTHFQSHLPSHINDDTGLTSRTPYLSSTKSG